MESYLSFHFRCGSRNCFQFPAARHHYFFSRGDDAVGDEGEAVCVFAGDFKLGILSQGSCVIKRNRSALNYDSCYLNNALESAVGNDIVFNFQDSVNNKPGNSCYCICYNTCYILQYFNEFLDRNGISGSRIVNRQRTVPGKKTLPMRIDKDHNFANIRSIRISIRRIRIIFFEGHPNHPASFCGLHCHSRDI